MNPPVAPRFLILETSCRVGHVALAQGERICCERQLDDNRRNGRDLAPTVADLLAAQGWKPRDVHAVLVGRGPGSYTGLRVGIMSAKTFAYVTGCVLLGIETFPAVAEQTPAGTDEVDVLADAQQDRVYIQEFVRTTAGWQGRSELAIRPFADWLTQRRPEARVSGPGLSRWEQHLPVGVSCVPRELREARPLSLLRLGLARFLAGQSDDIVTLEPLYLRPSSAEEQWKKLGR